MPKLRIMTLFIFGTWLWGFASFVVYVLFIPQTTTPVADAVVVLTGRKGRIAEGNKVVELGLAHKLFISGVHKKVRHTDLTSADHATPEGLGYQAKNTLQNGQEIAQWQTQYGWKTIRLVTDAVHMPRSLLHVRKACPNLQVIPHATHPQVPLRVYVSEFHKFAYNVLAKKLGFQRASTQLQSGKLLPNAQEE